MKKYIDPQATVIYMDPADIITASSTFKGLYEGGAGSGDSSSLNEWLDGSGGF